MWVSSNMEKDWLWLDFVDQPKRSSEKNEKSNSSDGQSPVKSRYKQYAEHRHCNPGQGHTTDHHFFLWGLSTVAEVRNWLHTHLQEYYPDASIKIHLFYRHHVVSKDNLCLNLSRSQDELQDQDQFGNELTLRTVNLNHYLYHRRRTQTSLLMPTPLQMLAKGKHMKKSMDASNKLRDSKGKFMRKKSDSRGGEHNEVINHIFYNSAC